MNHNQNLERTSFAGLKTYPGMGQWAQEQLNNIFLWSICIVILFNVYLTETN